MMQSAEIRQHFFDFFKSKGHTIVSSAPIVIKDDPTLLFTNAGMNQFKDYFLGNKKPPYSRVADTQKCLRVSGKHNDLEEVGVDTYHHTMFEMLGNWSFGNSTENPAPYFKKEAIAWAWELLTEIYKIDKQRLYVTVFEGDENPPAGRAGEGLPKDEEAISFWKKWISEDRIIMGKKKDNFWEMGDSGPCGPCTEIHVDSRTDDERKNIDGKNLVNNDHPQVIEIWNVVFIQYNRKKDGSLESLSAKHVDTGMGFERLVRVLQNKQSNYDTDIFTETIAEVEMLSNKKYTNTDSKQDVAFRVIADHIRAIAFPIADGQLPSNTGAGYVIRRILRRAVRYYFSYLDVKEPTLFKLIPLLAKQFESVFPELNKQRDFVGKVVHEEEESFLRTLGRGLILLDSIITAITKEDYSFNENQQLAKEIFDIKNIGRQKNDEITISGNVSFTLYDRYGFPFDLTRLIAQEKGLKVDEDGFNKEMLQQKNRSRAAAEVEKNDWEILSADTSSRFSGYDNYQQKTFVTKYRKINIKGKDKWQIVVANTPFYPESGGQVGDTGTIEFLETKQKITIINTIRENDLIIHLTEQKPYSFLGQAIAQIDINKRKKTAVHHSATHLMHAALRKVLGNHVAQKGSLVNDEYLRFDFSHFAKVTDEEIAKVESIVNKKIRENIPVVIKEMKKEEALATGAMALFGEKYGDMVRVVTIDPLYSIELCGGTHVGNTGELGFFKITSETTVGAGIRRIEAISGKAAEELINKELNILKTVRERLKNPKDLLKAIDNTTSENNQFKKRIEKLLVQQLTEYRNELVHSPKVFISHTYNDLSSELLKKLAFDVSNDLKKQNFKDFLILLFSLQENKVNTALAISDFLISSKNLDASKIIKEYIAPLINGGGGGQKTLATAGGQDVSKLNEVIEKVKSLLKGNDLGIINDYEVF
jgi:alanyl-tRNA synthetase